MKTPFWLAIWLVIVEALVVTALVPGDWTKHVIEEESQLLEQRLGPQEHRWVHDRARRWYNTSLIESGVYSAAHNHIIPTQEEIEKSRGMSNLGRAWFIWAEDRLQAIANAYYHILSRFALMLTWAPYFLILLVPAVYDGVITWRIKRTNFSYPSPLIHQYSTIGLFYLFITLVALFLAPVVLDPAIIPAAIMMACVMSGLMIGNFQKRM